MANSKYSRLLVNRYTGQEVEITGSTEDILNKRCDEQIDKWEKEEYIWEQREKADKMTNELPGMYDYLSKLCYIDMKPVSPRTYFDEYINRVVPLERYKPTLKDAEKAVGISSLSKITGHIPIFGLKERYKKEYDKAKERYQQMRKDYEVEVENDIEDYQKRLREKKNILKKELSNVKRGNSEAVRKYFLFVLHHDDYSVNGSERFYPEFSIVFLSDTQEMTVSYRIPNDEDFFIIAKYEYNEKTDSIEPRSYDSKTTAKMKLRIAESILLRTVAMVFESDQYESVKLLTITGYLCYYDSAYGNNQIKNVIRFTISRELFKRITLESVEPLDLFQRVLKAQISHDLYKKEPYTISAID